VILGSAFVRLGPTYKSYHSLREGNRYSFTAKTGY